MTKLDNHGYPEPWKFIDDVHLMLENAFMYNRKNTRIYKNAAKVDQHLTKFIGHKEASSFSIFIFSLTLFVSPFPCLFSSH